jgi:murein L,D-transpeptidase YcbB/YkuD
VRAQYCVGKAVALALFSVSLASCGDALGEERDRIAAAAVAKDPQVRAFYAARNGQPAWDGKSEKALLEALDGAPVHGLRRDLFLKGELPKERSEREAVLTSAALRYASALAHGYVDPGKLGRVYTVPRPKADVTPGLSKALEEGKLAIWFDSLAPQTEEYRALSAEFVRLLKLAQSGNGPTIKAGKAIKPGTADSRLPAIATALTANGYLAAQASAPARYSPDLVAAVKRLQADYGLKPDGVIGAVTIAALNQGPGDRARQLAVNLDRLRWLDRNPPATRIEVNTAAAVLDYWRDGQHRDRRNVVVGQPDWETPELGSPIFQLVAHPYWRVPDSILQDELKDKSAAYLAEQRMEWRDGRLVQLQGPKNSLGDVKFDMRNDQHIYLHDTPAKALFTMPERHRSHGCVRVQDAVGFAMLLAQDDGILPKFQQAMAKTDEEGFVKMKTEVPVRLMYRTAFLDSGKVRLVDDIYGWDNEVAYRLGYVRRPARPKQPHRHGADVGP